MLRSSPVRDTALAIQARAVLARLRRCSLSSVSERSLPCSSGFGPEPVCKLIQRCTAGSFQSIIPAEASVSCSGDSSELASSNASILRTCMSHVRSLIRSAV